MSLKIAFATSLNYNVHDHVSLANCILSLFCNLYLLGELSKDGHVSIMW